VRGRRALDAKGPGDDVGERRAAEHARPNGADASVAGGDDRVERLAALGLSDRSRLRPGARRAAFGGVEGLAGAKKVSSWGARTIRA
jgi:hypothetical protein